MPIRQPPSDDARPPRIDPASSLGELQRAILRDLWREGDSSVRDVLARLRASGLELAYTTVLTVMVRLARRGLLARRRVGRADIYRAGVAPAELPVALSREALDRLFETHGEAAMSAFADRLLTSDRGELERLRRQLEREEA